MTPNTSSPLDETGQLVEEPPTDRSSIGLWVVLLAGPVIWITHFAVVYLLAEASCASVRLDGIRFFGADALVVVVVAATVVAGAACAAMAWWSWRHARADGGDEAALGWAGVLLGVGSLFAIAAAGLPALVLDPC